MAAPKRLTAAEAAIGMRAAYDGALDVLRNPKSPPTSKASASNSMLKIVEMVQKGDPEDKEPCEMSWDEMQATIKALQNRQAEIEGSAMDDTETWDDADVLE